MRKLLLLLLLLLTVMLSGAERTTLEKVMKPERMSADSHHLYVTEGATIYVFSMKDFKLLRTFGKAGEGPEEFKLSSRPGGRLAVFHHPNHLVINSFERLSLFTPEGKFLKEMKGSMFTGDFRPLGDGYVGRAITFGKGKNTMVYSFYDAELKKTKEIFKVDIIRKGHEFNPFPVSFSFAVHDGLVFVCGKTGFDISAYGRDGKKKFAITRDYERIKVTEAFKKQQLADAKARGDEGRYQYYKTNVRFPEYLPAVSYFTAADGKLYVRTHKKEGEKDELFIFKTDGTFLDKIFTDLSARTHMIKNGKLYALMENEETEEWELLVSSLL